MLRRGAFYNTHYFYANGRLKPPTFYRSIFGILGGIGTDLDHLVT